MVGAGYYSSGLTINCPTNYVMDGVVIDISNQLGMYKYHAEINGRPSFKHTINNCYLFWSTINTWMVGVNSLNILFLMMILSPFLFQKLNHHEKQYI